MAAMTQDVEQAFRKMTDEQKRLSFSMNSKHLLPNAQSPNIRKDLVCALCQAILVDPLKCTDCKNHFHTACLNKFCRETGSCPMMCKKPKFVPVKKELLKELAALKFQCVNSEYGCDKILSYIEATDGQHESTCKFALVKCEAFSHCKTLCVRREIEQHQSICPFFLVPCIFCLKMVRRVEMAQHEKETCEGCHGCPTCGIIVQREELLTNSHSCLVALTRYLYKAIDEKDYVIANLREELERKNKQISTFLDRQNHLEQRLQRIQDVLMYEEEEEEVVVVQTKKKAAPKPKVPSEQSSDIVNGDTRISLEQIENHQENEQQHNGHINKENMMIKELQHIDQLLIPNYRYCQAILFTKFLD